MNKNRQLNCYSQAKIEKAFIPTIKMIYECIGNKAFKRDKGFVPTFFEAVMVGIAKRLELGDIENLDEFKKQYTNLVSNKTFLDVSVKIRDLTNEHNLKERLRMATETFADLQ